MDSLDSLVLEERELPHGKQNEFLIVILLSFICYLASVDSMMLMPLMKTIMTTYDIGTKSATLIISVYAFTAFISGILSSAFMDLYDRKVLLLVTFIGFTIGTGLCSFGTNFYLMIFYRGITGLFGGIIGGVATAIISDIIPYNRRATAISIISLSFALAAITGIPIVLYLTEEYSIFLPFKVLAIISVLTVAATIHWIPSVRFHLENLKEKKRFSISHISEVLTDSNQLLALIFAFLLVFGHQVVILFVVPYFENNLGFSKDLKPLMYLIGGIFTVLTSLPIGKFSDKVGNFKAFAILLFLSFIPILITTHITHATVYMVIGICVLFFIFAAGRMIPAYTIMSAAMTKEKRGAFMSMRSAFLELGTFVASMCSGFIVIIDDITGKVYHYPVVGYISVFTGLICLALAYRIKVISVD